MHTEVSSVYMVVSAGIRHFGQQVIQGQQADGFDSQFILTRTCEWKEYFTRFLI